MKTTLKASAALLILFAISCSKEVNSKQPAVSTLASANTVAADTVHYIGENYGGGIVYYIDSTGRHGFIAATANQSAGITWNKDKINIFTGATNSSIGAGKANTAKIIAAYGNTGNYAALLCTNYRGGGYSDWFLPSKAELIKLAGQKDVVGGFTGGNYWSSTEADAKNAWFIHFHRTLILKLAKSNVYHVRAIRQF